MIQLFNTSAKYDSPVQYKGFTDAKNEFGSGQAIAKVTQARPKTEASPRCPQCSMQLDNICTKMPQY